MKFFCTIYEPIPGGYKVLLNDKNINFLPGANTTLRRVFINAKLGKGQTIYVSNSELGNGGKLSVKEAFVLSDIDTGCQPEVLPMDQNIKAMIASSDVKPSELYTHV